MKIGICCNVFGPSGGMERYTLDLTRGLLENGHDVEIFTKKIKPMDGLDFDVPVRRCNLSLFPGKLHDYLFSLWLKKAKEKHHIATLIGCCRNFAADLAICGGTHVGFLKAIHRDPRLSDKLAIHVERRYYCEAKTIVAHSKLMAKELQEFYAVDPQKIKVLYPPSSLVRFSPCSEEERIRLREQLGLPKDRKVFLFVSSSHERKGFPLLQKFFETTDLPVTLAVAGRPIPQGLKNIRYLGYRNDIENLYRACDFSILASLYEPFGLAAVESLLCGTPVVIADNVASGEIIPDSSKFTFKCNDLSSLSCAIAQAVKCDSTALPDIPAFSETLEIRNHVKAIESLIS
jgi:glycosyltransferase involved in cell wall biosynthesis